MERFTGILGLVLIFGIAFLLSNNRRAINYRLVITGCILQLGTAFFILKIPIGQVIFAKIGYGITKMLEYSMEGARFCFGFLADGERLNSLLGPGNSWIFVFTLIPAIIFVCVLVAIGYHIGLLQRVIAIVAQGVYWIMRVSGSEALSNVASAFVGQVEAQILIRPYISGMTMSELLASMSGSMACIAGGVLAIYVAMGVPAPYLLAASLMAAPGALVISKIVYPETQESETKGRVKLEVKKTHANLMDAISHGASDGMRISINVIAMLIGVIALVALLDALLGWLGELIALTGLNLQVIGLNLEDLRLKDILGSFFSLFAWTMGVSWHEAHTVGVLMGTKMVINEFVAYTDLAPMIASNTLSPKALIIASFALCGFANFGSVAIQIGGIGELAPNRRRDLARLGIKAMICGTLASYVSATLAGMIL
ncbi:MAG: NupC/NupG family nucleoside CNT transporter [Bacteroidetes bacterium]|nr:MAG: NupC/NupG family nucleoside CNT transporter [Bacteroidota bacterium]